MRYRQVVLVLIDGLRPDAVVPQVMPALHLFGARYWKAPRAVTVRPSVTSAALTSLTTGVAPATHGLIEPGIASLANLRSLRPLPQELSRNRIKTAVVMNELPAANRLIAQTLLRLAGVANLWTPGEGPQAVVEGAREALDRETAGLTMLYLNRTDLVGHRSGWMSPAYLEAAWEVDLALRPLLDLADHPERLVIVTADHGGGGLKPNCHDQPHPLNDAIPLFIGGRATVRGTGAARQVSLLDVPPTVLHALGVRVPSSYEGRVLHEALGTPIEATGRVLLAEEVFQDPFATFAPSER